MRVFYYSGTQDGDFARKWNLTGQKHQAITNICKFEQKTHEVQLKFLPTNPEEKLKQEAQPYCDFLHQCGAKKLFKHSLTHFYKKANYYQKSSENEWRHCARKSSR